MIRGVATHHLAVRLADEGVPVKAIARALLVPSDEIYPVLEAAKTRGEIVSLPAADWPPGQRFAAGPQRSCAPLRFEDLDALSLNLQRIYALTRAQARVLAVLVLRPAVARTMIHIALAGGAPETDPKIVDVVICKLRAVLRPYQIAIETIWGRGYALAPGAAEAIRVRLAADERRAA